MRFIVLSLFLLSLFLCFSSSVVQGQYAGAFLTSASVPVAKGLFAKTSPYDELNAVDQSYQSAKALQAHHMTIEFQPQPVTKYQQFYGDFHSLKVLAYAHDAHGQAVLVELEDNACKSQGGIDIANEWSHVTISTEGKGNYTSVYSNDLIGRLFYTNILRVIRKDSYGKATRVALVNQTISEKEWWGIAPGFTAAQTTTTPEKTYPPTPVYVKIFPQEGHNVLRLGSIVCLNTAWNDTAKSCTAPKVL